MVNQTRNLTINIETNGTKILSELPILVNNSTNHYFAWFVLGAISIIYFITLSDKTPFGDFKYSDLRSVAISLGAVSVFGITNLQLNFFTNLKAVAFFVMLFMVTFLIILGVENKE